MNTEPIHEIKNIEDFKQMEDREGIKIVAFLADYIAPSRKYKDILTSFIEGDVFFPVFIVSADTNPEICEFLKIRNFPTTRIYKNREFKTFLGVLTEGELNSQVNAI